VTINVSYSQFLFSNGVPRNQADTVGKKIASKIQARQPLTQDEAVLTTVFLNRPDANKAAERHIGAAMLTSNIRSTASQSPGRRTPAHTPEWTDLKASDPGNASARQNTQTVGAAKSITVGAARSGVHVRGWDHVLKKPVIGKDTQTEVRALAKRISISS